MSRLFIPTRGIGSWRDRLAAGDRHWKHGASAMETAVSWETAASSKSGLPESIAQALASSGYADPMLLLAVAEHAVPLPGRGGRSQCDVWGVIHASMGAISFTVEAKADEPFGDRHQSLANWLISGTSPPNRVTRWQEIQKHLPDSPEGAYAPIAYQLLHRCAAAVIEARRLHLHHAILLVQAFDSPATSFAEYDKFCQVLGLPSTRGQIHTTKVDNISLGLGWVDCPKATDRMIAATA